MITVALGGNCLGDGDAREKAARLRAMVVEKSMAEGGEDQPRKLTAFIVCHGAAVVRPAMISCVFPRANKGRLPSRSLGAGL